MIPTRERQLLRPVAAKPEIIDLPGARGRAKDFGISGISSTTATVLGGTVIGFTGVVEIADTVVSCGGTEAAPHYIVAQGGISPLTGSILANSVLKSSFSGHSATVWRRPLAEVCIVNGMVRVRRVKHEGVIDLKSWVGP